MGLSPSTPLPTSTIRAVGCKRPASSLFFSGSSSSACPASYSSSLNALGTYSDGRRVEGPAYWADERAEVSPLNQLNRPRLPAKLPNPSPASQAPLPRRRDASLSASKGTEGDWGDADFSDNGERGPRSSTLTRRAVNTVAVLASSASTGYEDRLVSKEPCEV